MTVPMLGAVVADSAWDDVVWAHGISAVVTLLGTVAHDERAIFRQKLTFLELTPSRSFPSNAKLLGNCFKVEMFFQRIRLMTQHFIDTGSAGVLMHLAITSLYLVNSTVQCDIFKA